MSLNKKSTDNVYRMNMLQRVRINNEKVIPIPVPKLDPEKIKGYDLFPELYSNTFLCARKKSGKTNAINTIIQKCSDKYTAIIFFASTIHKDDTLKAIVEKCKKRGNIVETYTSMYDDGMDLLSEYMNQLKKNSEQEQEQVDEKGQLINILTSVCAFDPIIDPNNPPEVPEKKRRKQKKLSPEIIFVFDDLGDETKSPLINQLLKTNRHYKCKVIISSQYPNDLTPQALKQIDYCLLFGGHPPSKLEKLKEDFDVTLPQTEFDRIYYDATSDPYHFLYIDVKNGLFRKDFNEEYSIS